MNKNEIKKLFFIIIIFILAFYLPIGFKRFDNAILESFHLLRWYAREHVLLCLIPAFFIAGAIVSFVNKNSIMKYLGVKSNKIIAYTVASLSGSILAVCSCTILPLFSGIYKMGAGLGPATTFLYSGPAINVLAIILTTKVLGIELGIARTVGAIMFSIVIGLIMSLLFNKEEKEKAKLQNIEEKETRPLFQTAIYFFLMILILIFSNWGESKESLLIFKYKWHITSALSVAFSFVLYKWFNVSFIKIILAIIITSIITFIFKNPILSFSFGVLSLTIISSNSSYELKSWRNETWSFAKQILPLLFFGVLMAGFLLGRPGSTGIIPSHFISSLVGGNSFFPNFFASVAGAFMYFATLTEIPILQGLLNSGMGKGPALALLLAGPAISLPNMLVIKSVMGFQKTLVYIVLVIILSTLSGILYGVM